MVDYVNSRGNKKVFCKKKKKIFKLIKDLNQTSLNCFRISKIRNDNLLYMCSTYY